MIRLKITLLLFITISLLTACGASSGGTASVTKNASQAAINIRKPAPSVHDQVSTIVRHEDMWLKEDSRIEGEGEDSYVEGPLYSLMDLDQDGYLEIVVTDETGQNCPSFYEVTEDDSLQKWTMSGDLPQSGPEMSIFDTTSRADCYYDPSRHQYHYIVWDKLDLCQDHADVTFLDMMTDDTGVTFKKIGRYTFDAQTDGEYHYFNEKGEECKEHDITSGYSNMTKKTMYYSKTPISKKEAGEVWGYNMEHTMWKQFILRDDYRPERAKELTTEFRYQFVSLSISMSEYVTDLSKRNQTDEIRYTATDLDNDQYVELIIENVTKQTWCIHEESDDDDFEPGKWKTKGKKLTDYTNNNPSITWQTCTVSDFNEMSYDLIEDNLRECWLHYEGDSE